MPQISEAEVFRACRTLFGPELRLNRDFLLYLQPSGAHSAFRKRAKTTHPDTRHFQPQHQHRQLRQFQDLNQAHELLQSYLRQRDLLAARSRVSTATKPSRPAQSTARDPFHAGPVQGPLPTRPLQFGVYLYYRGLIPFITLINALAWQRRQRPNIGQLAKRWGWLNDEEIGQILASRQLGRFGEKAERLGLLKPIQVRAILLHQRNCQGKLGHFFVDQGLVTAEEIEQLLCDLSTHNLSYRHGYPHHFYYHR